MTSRVTDLYFEAHVTIEPVFGKRLELFRAVTAKHGFRAAELLMKKSRRATAKRSEYDTFCTGRSVSLDDLKSRMMGLVARLTLEGFDVWRYKLEETLLDVRLREKLEVQAKKR